MGRKRKADFRWLLLVLPLLIGLFSQTVARAEATDFTSPNCVMDIEAAQVRQYISAGLAAATEENFNVIAGENIKVSQDLLQSVRDSDTTLALTREWCQQAVSMLLLMVIRSPASPADTA